jgi:hypothetical protein
MRSILRRVVWSGVLALAGLAILTGSLAAEEAAPAAAEAAEEQTIKPETAAAATHKEIKSVKVVAESGATLQTLAATPDGKLVALRAPARYAPIGQAGTSANSSAILVFDRDGNELKQWSLPFAGQSIGVAPGGEIYVAGDGQIARYSADGKLLAQADTPHLAELKDEAALREAAEEQVTNAKQSVESMKSSKKTIENMVNKLEDTPADKLTALKKSQLDAFRQHLKTFDQQMEARANMKIETVIKGLTSRLRLINAIAPTDTDVFIACGELKGYGYSIWRMDADDFANPQKIVGGLAGCCGQMDIQAGKNGIYVAENSKKRVSLYDRNGKAVSAFGVSGRESNGLSFGGCCNPMNCRIAENSDIYTAESEGIIKRFSASGKFLSLIGYVKLSGGCKNVAVAASPKGDRIYVCDLPGQRIIVLGLKAESAAAGE